MSMRYYYGKPIRERDDEVKHIKEPDNEDDKKAISVEIDALIYAGISRVPLFIFDNVIK